MKLDKKTLDYFERQRKKNSGPIVVLYIDAHGGETMDKSCSKDSATIFSFAGISGASAYSVKYNEDTRSSIYFREIIAEMNADKPTTKTLKKRAKEISDVIKPQLKTHSNNAKPSHVKDWSRKHFDKYALTPMKQINHKKFFFYEKELSLMHYFDFGIHITDIVYPSGHPPDEVLESLKGQNLISESFDEEGLFPEAQEFLSKISENTENTKAFEHPVYDRFGDADILVRVMTFDEIIHLLKLLGFEYSYIFDDSCRSHELVSKKNTPKEEDLAELEKMAKKERKVSLEKLPFKMLSTDMPKTRKRILSNKREVKVTFMKELSDKFHAKILDYLEDEVTKMKDNLNEKQEMEVDTSEFWIDLVKDTDKKMSFNLKYGSQKILTININTTFQKGSHKVDNVEFTKKETTTKLKNITETFISELDFKNL